mmetsp:Transcript_8289/g.28197  ORF Transcript_8289/g.28197 Transcript_8289/m.28197 type:complete len:216 (-) Transcript_8289:378-1025(-)
MVINVVPFEGECIKAYDFVNHKNERFAVELGHPGGLNGCFFASRVQHAVRTRRGPYLGIQTYCVVLPRGMRAPTGHVERLFVHLHMMDSQWREMLALSDVPADALIQQVYEAISAFVERVRRRAEALAPPSPPPAPIAGGVRKPRMYVKRHSVAHYARNREWLRLRNGARYKEKRAQEFASRGMTEAAERMRAEALKQRADADDARAKMRQMGPA